MSIEMTEFTECDWNGLSGCTPFGDPAARTIHPSDQPMVAYDVPVLHPEAFFAGEDVVNQANPGKALSGADPNILTLDATGITLTVFDADSGMLAGYQLQLNEHGWFNREVGEAIVAQLSTPLDVAQLRAFGFTFFGN